MKNEIVFSPEANGGFSGWFEFDPKKQLGWSFEETVARIYRLTEGQDVFGSQEKSSFDASGFISRGNQKLRFLLCDWREDKQIHVMLGDVKRPKGFRKIEFITALKHALSQVQPKEFRSTYVYSENIFSWPPSPTQDEAIAMAHDALAGLLGIDDWNDEAIAPKKVVEDARAAMKALEEAF